jgi:hypothetical protein
LEFIKILRAKLIMNSFFRLFAKRCPSCKKGKLQSKNFFRATCVSENGTSHPDAWSFYICDICKTKLKIYVNGKTIEPSEEEWADSVK